LPVVVVMVLLLLRLRRRLQDVGAEVEPHLANANQLVRVRPDEVQHRRHL
jgi:hypothetical protein